MKLLKLLSIISFSAATFACSSDFFSNLNSRELNKSEKMEKKNNELSENDIINKIINPVFKEAVEEATKIIEANTGRINCYLYPRFSVDNNQKEVIKSHGGLICETWPEQAMYAYTFNAKKINRMNQKDVKETISSFFIKEYIELNRTFH